MHPDPLSVERLFDEAMELEPRDRAAFLDERCASNLALLQRVKALLAAHELASGFLPELSQDAILMVNEPAPTERAGTTIGRYKLLEKLGEGGFGVVWAAEQHEPIRRRVALKIIKLGMDTRQVIARFEAERQALALMDHPNIAKVLDAGATETGRPYFVMELTPGIPITTYCEEWRLQIKDRLHLFIKICHAIQHAHQKGIIHRDIKPSNIIVVSQDGEAVPKVIDFGIAKATQTGLDDQTVFTQLQQFVGTPAYMSPEQADRTGSDIDTRSDIYSLGVLLYELLTCNTPFDGKALLQGGLDEMRRVIREQEPLRPSTKLHQSRADTVQGGSRKTQITISKSEIDKDLDWIVMKCLEKDRTRRYETANGLATDLKRHLNNEPVVARPPSTAYRLQKTFRRNKLAFAAATVVVVALVVGLGISGWQATVATRARLGETRQRVAAELAQKQAERERSRAEVGEKAGQQLLYAANMNLAQQAWEQNNVSRVRQLLEETAAYPDRGFEWYYWQRQAHLERRTFRGHTDGLWVAAFSPDGKRIVTGSGDHTAKVWDNESGRELFSLEGHADWVTDAAFSPDGQRIVTASSDQTARMWDATTGRQILVFIGHSHWITSVDFSPDGKRIVTGSHDGTAKVWDAATGTNLLILKGHSIPWAPVISSVAFSGDGKRIVTGGYDSTAKVWNATNGNGLFTLKGHGGSILSVAFSRDGQRIVTGGVDKTAKVWDGTSGKELRSFSGHASRVTSVAFSPDGQRIMTGSRDSTAKVWDAQSGKELFTFKGHHDGVSSVTFSPDGKQVLTASRGHVAKVWDAEMSDALTLRGHIGEISSVAFAPDGQRLITTGEDKTARMWDVTNGRELFTLVSGSHAFLSVAFAHDGRRIATGGGDWKVRVWDVSSRSELLTLSGHTEVITSIAFSADDGRIITGSYDHSARIWNAASGKELVALRGHTDFVTSAAFSPNGLRVATGSYDGTARIWDPASGQELSKFGGRIASVAALHPAFGSSGSLVLKGRFAAIRSVAFSPDGRKLATGGDGTATVWDAGTGEELLTLKGHVSRLSSVSFSPEGRRILTTSDDGTARLWDAASGQQLLTLAVPGKDQIGRDGQTFEVTAATFSRDGRRIVTSSSDSTARIWEAASAKQVELWQQMERSAATHLESARREEAAAVDHARTLRAEDPGVIKQWLILAPVAFHGILGRGAIDQEQLPHEAHLRPRAGEKAQVVGGERAWKAVQLEDYLIDFTKLLGGINASNVAYAVCYIHSKGNFADLVMKVGS
ncbi:MAG TPA: protein kinase, partial [Verrucomicrobiae bacterium]|nr:protein kinase [Verrucomicrobiae bacterium]